MRLTVYKSFVTYGDKNYLNDFFSEKTEVREGIVRFCCHTKVGTQH